MRLAVLTVRLDPATGAFDTSALDRFHAGREVLEVGEHFFVHDQTPTLALVIRYRDVEPQRFPRPDAQPRKDWRAELDPPAKVLYDELRTWRGRRAKHEGMPPFLILGNRELAAVAATRPDSLTGLRGIDGIGAAKVERWGAEILEVLAAFGGRTTPDLDSSRTAAVAAEPGAVGPDPAPTTTDADSPEAEVPDAP